MNVTPFGIKVRQFRLEKRLTLKDMAEALGKTSSYISALETGKKSIPMEYINSFCDYFELDDVTKQELIKLAEDSKPIIKMNLESVFGLQRSTALTFARNFENLSEDQLKEIEKMCNPGE